PAENQDLDDDDDGPAIFPQEHLQLSLEEAFFLSYGLGVLDVYDGPEPDDPAVPPPQVIPPTALLALFSQTSQLPRHPPQQGQPLPPDDPFLTSYVAYHHFRALGWVVRSGVKFGADYVLYNRGPVFSHAEFAVVVLPAYSHAAWAATPERRAHVAARLARTSWWWLHCVNRVQAQVKKTLVLCYVEIPPPTTLPSLVKTETDTKTESGVDVDVGALLGRYRVREFIIRRWVPNRTRD
ncbi:hypothetical protein KEM52_002629, partial [Ascosphaera acerosa]